MRGKLRLCAAAVALLMLLCACTRGGGKVRYFSYLDVSAQCLLSGKLNGTAFTAMLQSDGRKSASGEIAECAASFTLTYLSPASLAGVKVSYDSETSTYRVTLGELHAEGEEYAALGAVGALLLTERAVESTRRDEQGYIHFETMDGATRTIDAQGNPVRAKWCGGGQRIEAEVSEWRTE